MATPNVTVDIADFLSGNAPASKSGYPITLTPVPFVAPDVRQAITNSSGQATLSAVVPGNYDLQILGLGIEPRRVVVTDEAGPLDASELAEADTGGRVPDARNPLIAGENITITDTAAGIKIDASGGGEALPDGVQLEENTIGLNDATISEGSLNIVIEDHASGQSGIYVSSADSSEYGEYSEIQMQASTADAAFVHVSSNTDAVRSVEISASPEGAIINMADGAVESFLTLSAGNLLDVQTDEAVSKFKISTGGAITTAAPEGGTAGAWKLGVKVDATVELDTAKYLQVDIGGVLYKVALVTEVP